VGGIGNLVDKQGESLVKDLKNITTDISERIPVTIFSRGLPSEK
jgi:hypothetical protein